MSPLVNEKERKETEISVPFFILLYAEKAVRSGGLFVVFPVICLSAILFLFHSEKANGVYLPMIAIRTREYCSIS